MDNNIVIIDDILDSIEYQKLSEIMYQNPAWIWGGKTDYENENSARLWQINFKNGEGVVDSFILKLWETIKKKVKLTNSYEIFRVYANGQTYGMDGDWHTDSDDTGMYTFLYYFTKGDENIIGDTEFMIDEKLLSIKPLKNTGILFSSNLKHRGCAPKKEFKDLRITIAFKLIKKGNTLL